jgi:hypothetical protein
MTIRCDCGSEIRVPSLSSLRELSGIAPYESSVLDTIQGMVERGELPEGEVCAFCGEPTLDTLGVHVVVPRAFEQVEGLGAWLLTLLWSPLFSWGFIPVVAGIFQGLFGRTVPIEESILTHQNARSVYTPLRVASRHHGKVRRGSQRRLKRLLRTVPVYAKLLDENPIVRIFVPTGNRLKSN